MKLEVEICGLEILRKKAFIAKYKMLNSNSILEMLFRYES
jgi:hypothetical protein